MPLLTIRQVSVDLAVQRIPAGQTRTDVSCSLRTLTGVVLILFLRRPTDGWFAPLCTTL